MTTTNTNSHLSPAKTTIRYWNGQGTGDVCVSVEGSNFYSMGIGLENALMQLRKNNPYLGKLKVLPTNGTRIVHY